MKTITQAAAIDALRHVFDKYIRESADGTLSIYVSQAMYPALSAANKRGMDGLNSPWAGADGPKSPWMGFVDLIGRADTKNVILLSEKQTLKGWEMEVSFQPSAKKTIEVDMEPASPSVLDDECDNCNCKEVCQTCVDAISGCIEAHLGESGQNTCDKKESAPRPPKKDYSQFHAFQLFLSNLLENTSGDLNIEKLRVKYSAADQFPPSYDFYRMDEIVSVMFLDDDEGSAKRYSFPIVMDSTLHDKAFVLDFKEVKEVEPIVTLEEAAKPLVEHMKSECNSHTIAIVDCNSVEIMEGVRKIDV